MKDKRNITGLKMARKIPKIIKKDAFSMGEKGKPNIVYQTSV